MESITPKAARVNVGLTQKEMAEKLGMSYQHYCYLERNPGRLRLETARKIAEIVKQPMNLLFFCDGN